MANRLFPELHGPIEESAWEGGGRAGFENYLGQRHEVQTEEPLALSDEELADKRRPAPGHSAITPGVTGPSTREDEVGTDPNYTPFD